MPAPTPSAPAPILRPPSRLRTFGVAAAAALVAGVVALSPLRTPAADATVTELLTVNQSTFEAGPSGWVAEPVARVTLTRKQAVEGRQSLRVAASASSFIGTRPMQVSTTPGTAGVRVTPGVTYTGRFQVRPGGVTDNVACELTWFGANGAVLGRSTGPWRAESAGAWTASSCASVAPAGAAYAALRVKFESAAWGEVHFVDDAGLIGSTAPPTTAPPTTAPPTTAPPAANLLDGNQQSFEAAFSGWITQGNASATRSTLAARVGSASMRVVGSTSDPVHVDGTRTVRVATSTGTEGVSVTAGRTYLGSAQVMSTNETSPVRCELRWYRADGSILDTALGAEVNEVPGTWANRTCQATAPPGAAFAALRVHVANADTGDVHYVDDAWLVDSAGTPPPPTTAPPTTVPPTTAPPTTAPPTTAPPTTVPPPPLVPAGTYPARGAVGFRGDAGSLRVIDGPEDAPAGTTWQGGYLQVDAANLTLDGVYVRGGIDFYGGGTLTIRNSIVEFGYGAWLTILGRTPGQTIDIRDSTLRYRAGATPSMSDPAAIQIQAGLTIVALRNDISGSTDGIQAAGPNTRIEQNWIHDLALVGVYPNNTHNDGVQVYDGQNMVIANNRIEVGFDGQHQNAALFFQPGGGNSINVTISGNYLQGGGFTLRLEGPTTARVTGNTFGPLEGGAWGTHYVLDGAQTTEWTANVRTDGSTVSR